MSWILSSNTKKPSLKWSAPLILSWENWSYGTLSWWEVCEQTSNGLIQSRTDGIFNARLHYVHWKNINGFGGEKKTGRPSFIYKENANELEPEIINLQKDKHPWKKKKRDWFRFLEFHAVCTVSYFKTRVVKREYVRFYLLKRLRVFKIEVRIINRLYENAHY